MKKVNNLVAKHSRGLHKGGVHLNKKRRSEMAFDKTSDEYGDYLYEEKRDGWMMASEDNIKFVRIIQDLGWWQCTDGKNFESKRNAEKHQYDIERGRI